MIHAVPRNELSCATTPPNLFGFAQIKSGCVNPEGGYEPWHTSSRDYEQFLEGYGLAAAYRAGGMQQVLRAIGLTRMQTEAFALHVGMDFTQEQTARFLSVTQGAVSLRLKGARDRIRAWWGRNLIVLDLPTPIDEGLESPESFSA